MEPRTFLRIEGVTAVGLCVAGYLTLDGPLWLFLVLALAPDLSMLGYLAGPKVGSLSYNVVHTYTVPVALGAAGLWFDVPLAVLAALVWAAHIGVDRAFGFGLKFESGFADTHLSSQPVPFAALAETEE